MLARILTSDWGSSLSTFLPSAKAEMIPHLSRRIFYAGTLHDGKKNLSFTPEAFRAINRHRRLGNVDELQNRVKTAENMAYRGEITGNDSNLLHKLRLPLP